MQLPVHKNGISIRNMMWLTVMQTFPLSEFQAVVTENVHVHVLHVHGNDIC